METGQRNRKKTDKRKTVLVIFGGCSTEYEVSLQSAFTVLTHIGDTLYEVIPVGIDRNGQWYWYRGPAERIPENDWCQTEYCTPIVVSPNRVLHGILVMEGNTVIEKPVDAAFPILHGKNGEDGTVQGLLELADIPVAGCGTLCSALCMDKDMAHRVARDAGIRVPRGRIFGPEESHRKDSLWEEELQKAAQELGYPLFVKPVRSGSSFGITRVSGRDELIPAVYQALMHDSRVILEEAIEGFEVGCAILGSDRLVTGDVDEIELSDGFFDYTEKYTLKTSAIHVPARISREKTEQVKKTAAYIYRTLKCSGLAWVDLFLTSEGEIVFNEVNTIPGMTVHSRYPSMMESAGLPLGELIGRLLEMTTGKE